MKTQLEERVRGLIKAVILEARQRLPVKVRGGHLVEYGSKEHVDSVDEDLHTLNEMKVRYRRGSKIAIDIQRVRESIRGHLKSAQRVHDQKVQRALMTETD